MTTTHIGRPAWDVGESFLYCGNKLVPDNDRAIVNPPINGATEGEICEGCLDGFRPWLDAPLRDLRPNGSEGRVLHIEFIGAGLYSTLCGIAGPGSVITQFPEYVAPESAGNLCAVCMALYSPTEQYARWRTFVTGKIQLVGVN
jgi:hypothetical protein